MKYNSDDWMTGKWFSSKTVEWVRTFLNNLTHQLYTDNQTIVDKLESA